MATFAAKNSVEMKKKPMIILKELIFFVLVSTSGTSNWQAFEDSQWNKTTTFVFHKIVIYNPWTWKQSDDSLKISLTPKRSEFYRKKDFSVVAWGWGQNRSCWSMNVIIWTDVDSCLFISRLVLKYAIYRVFFLCEATKGAGDWWNYRLTRKSNNTWKNNFGSRFPVNF